ncbi:acetyl-CoA carboxylase biotin carboxyl carrier protein subunit [Bradyrhizobium sp.]|jgi:biotin carboxyl carrier protein|uniref:acetyl-CoA carboxylase biotin carboxyl carrier protein subunit n=1 Tax=Bradyrhizobium sp. TaxID=376 RepID=UPI003C4F05B5
MPDLKIATEVAGRVCKLAVPVSARVGEGEEIVVVEAMKMEIPAASPAAGIIKSILVRVDDLVSEGQIVAILET